MLSLEYTITLFIIFSVISLLIRYTLTGEILQKKTSLKELRELKEYKITINKKTPIELTLFITNYVGMYFFFVSTMLISLKEIGDILPFYLAFIIIIIFVVMHISIITILALLSKLDKLSRKKQSS